MEEAHGVVYSVLGGVSVASEPYASRVEPASEVSKRDTDPARRLEHTVEFLKPPLIEVACGVQFEPIGGWSTAHYGLFWKTLHSEYPRFEDYPPLPRFSAKGRPEIELEFTPLPPLRRVYFIDQTGNFVIQLQPSRFLHNWRRVSETDEYPKFEAAFGRFLHYWQKFENFLRVNGMGGPRLEMCELTYLNHIYGPDWRFPRDISKIVRVSDLAPITKALAEPIGVFVAFTSPLREGAGQLDVTIRSGRRTGDQMDVLVLELTARGRPQDIEQDMGQWFQLAHDAIVLTFLSLTTEEAQVSWGRRS